MDLTLGILDGKISISVFLYLDAIWTCASSADTNSDTCSSRSRHSNLIKIQISHIAHSTLCAVRYMRDLYFNQIVDIEK
jgi:hypothetical protein